jgi:hypothetical protein
LKRVILSEAVPLDLDLVAALEVQPEPFAGAEVPGESECGVGGDAALAVHDLVDPPRRHTDGHSDAVLGDAERLEVFEHQDFTGMDRLHGGCGHVTSCQW